MKNSLLTAATLTTLLAAGVAQAAPSIDWSGDMVFRTEQIKDDSAHTSTFTTDRIRQRLRLRLMGKSALNENMDAGFRVTTGSIGTTVSRNNDLGNWDGGQGMVLDLAYLTYKWGDMVKLTGGKMMNPFYQVNDVVFDGDVTPEGVAVGYKDTFGQTEVFVNAGTSWLKEQYKSAASPTTQDGDIMLNGVQLGANYKADSWNVKVIASSYYFNTAGVTAAAAAGNTLSGGAYMYDYKLTSIGAEFGTTVSEMPLTVFADSITNGGKDVSNNKTAITYGVKLNKLKAKGDWAVSVDNREVQKDAVLGYFTDGDSSGGGADINSLRAKFNYAFADNANVGFSYFTGKQVIATKATAAGSVDTGDASIKSSRMQLDFNASF